MNRSLLVAAILEALVIAGLLVWLAMRSAPTMPIAPTATAPAADPTTPSSLAAETSPPPRHEPAAAPARQPVASPAQPAVAAHDPLLGTVLVGRVIDDHGQPVDDASIYLRQPDEPRGVSAAFRPGRGYAIAGLDPGTWSLSCRADGCKPYTADVEVKDTPLQVFDVELQRAHVVRVAFVDENGEPAGKRWGEEKLFVGWRMSVVATVEPPPDSFPMSELSTVLGVGVGEWHDRLGGTELPERFAGVLQIGEPGPVWVSAVLRQEVVGKALVPPEQTDLDLVVDTATLKSKLATVRARLVAAETGAPLTEARFSVSDRQSGGAGTPPDADGNIVLENQIPGIVEIGVRAVGREGYQRQVRLLPGADLDLGVLAIEPQHQVSGVVLDPEGQPLGGVSLKWFRLDRIAADVPMSNGFSARSDTNGAFKLFGVGAGRYLVRATHDRGVAHVVVDTSAGDVDDFQIHLQRPVNVTIVNQVPSTAIYLVRIEDASGQPLLSWQERPMNIADRPLAVPAGRYHVEIRDDQHVVRRFDLDASRDGARLTIP